MKNDNLLLLEFMGEKRNTNKYLVHDQIFNCEDGYKIMWNFDLLMTAVEKIKFLGQVIEINIGFKDSSGSYSEIITASGKVFSVTGKGQKEGLFETIVMFLKWYNEQQN